MWNKVEEKLPEREGKYLVCYSFKLRRYEVVDYVFDIGLKTIDPMFPWEKHDLIKKGGGFCCYDDEYGYYEVHPIYWTELPEPPEERGRKMGEKNER